MLRDAILHLLAEDPTLEPRDVIVMCPDIETFAPLIQATFGAGEATWDEDDADALAPDARPPDLRVRLADRSLRQTNPVLGVVAQLLELAEQRLTASQVLDLADREPVRRRFRLDDDDLVRLEDWVAAAGIRWGLDAEHRAPFKLERPRRRARGAPASTACSLGVTMTEDEQRLFAGVLPLDDVDSGAIDLAGRFAELVDRLGDALDALQPRRSRSTPGRRRSPTRPTRSRRPARRDAWQRAELQRLLDDVVAEATTGGAGPSTPLALPEVRALLADRLRGRPTRANFRTGHLTICTLVPMRSVPHRVVCLLGLDDAAFPRRSPRDGDDLLLDDPHVGERDPRTEDRQMLLDALMAATDRLVDHLHRQRRAHEPRAPAGGPGRRAARRRRPHRARGRRRGARARRRPPPAAAVRRAQLHAPARSSPRRPWSFDRVDARRARGRSTASASAPGPFLPGPLPGERGRRWSRSRTSCASSATPCARSCASGSGSASATYADEVEDALPVELDALEEWGVGQRLLDARLAGADVAHRRAGRDRARHAAAGRARPAGRRPRAPGRRGHRRRAPGRARARRRST